MKKEIKFLKHLQKSRKKISEIRRFRLKKQSLMECALCNEIKSINDCYFNIHRCKECHRFDRKLYYKNNKEQQLAKMKEYAQRNPELMRRNSKTWKEKHPERFRKKSRIRYKNVLLFKLAHNLRTRTGQIVKQRRFNKTTKFTEYIGCTLNELKLHLESKFDSTMSWENYGTYWHIYHIVPLSIAKTEEEMYRLCHYTNLQPLWAIDNYKKSDKLSI